ncbi:MAG: hypothetical protein HYS26_04330 [Candidatus Kaiserbacteria bacterium]|nr:MAG: hypothetical protein HYS26_04330 [Candidatus Kaiserbacteria bacterium]
MKTASSVNANVFLGGLIALALVFAGSFGVAEAADTYGGDELGSFFGDGVGNLYGDGASYYYGDGGGSVYDDGSGFYFGDGAGNLYGDGASYYYGDGGGAYFDDGSGSIYGDGSGYYYGDGSGSLFGDGSDPYFGDGSGSYFGDGLSSYFGDGSGSYFGDGLGNFYGDGLGSYFGDGAGSLFGDGSNPYFGDGSGALFGDGTGALFGDSSPYDIYGLYSEYGIYDTYVDEFGTRYSMQNYSNPQYASAAAPFRVSAPSYSAPRSVSYPPSYTTPPVIRPQPPSYPPVYPQPPRPQPQPPVYFPTPSTNIVNTNTNTNINTNTCTGGSCNTNVSTVTPVYQTPIQYPVQYVYPQYPVYPQTPVYPQQGLYCIITTSQSYIQNGQATVLSWTSYGAYSAWLSDGIGNVSPNGSLTVRPNVSTNYVLTVQGQGGTRTCNVAVNVAGPSVSLSQIPYTGFDAGLLGNAAFYGSLLVFAAAGAYLALYYIPNMGLGFPKLAVATPKRSPVAQSSGSVAAPALFGKKVAPAIARSASLANLPVREEAPRFFVEAPKDAMSFVRPEDGAAPRIVIARS